MVIRWSSLAADDLECICERIERDNPEAARRVAQTIFDGCARLSGFPNLGRASIRVSGFRELVFPPALHRGLQGDATRRRNLAHLSRRTGLALMPLPEQRRNTLRRCVGVEGEAWGRHDATSPNRTGKSDALGCQDEGFFHVGCVHSLE